MLHADAAGRLSVRGEGVPGGKMLAVVIERDFPPVRFQANPPTIAIGFQGLELRGDIDVSFTQLHAAVGSLAASADGVLEMGVSDPIGDQGIVVVHRVTGAVYVEDIAGVPD